MRASDIMTREVCAVFRATSVQSIAKLLLDAGISGAPVVDENGHVAGIVSEGDLLHRREIGTTRRRSWWLSLFANADGMARDYRKSHGMKAEDVMTSPVVSVGEDAPIAVIAAILEQHRIKRVPVVRDGLLVGIVSRRDIVRALAAQAADQPTQADDRAILSTLMQRLRAQPWTQSGTLSLLVDRGVVELWGSVPSEDQREALKVLAGTIPGVTGVRDNLVVSRPIATAV